MIEEALRFGIVVCVALGTLTVAILITLTIATGVTAGSTSYGAQVGDTIENHAEDLGAGEIHQVDRVAGLLAGGFILAGDKQTVVGIIAD